MMSPKLRIIMISALLIIAITGGYCKIQIDKQARIKEQNQKIEAEKIRKQTEKDELNQLFDQHINNFKTDLKSHTSAYKKSRLVLKEIFSPHNFETKEYTKEIYLLFKNDVAPNLRIKADEIINIFIKYKYFLQTDISNQDDNLQKLFLLKWQEASKAQLSKYIDFFTKEEELIQAYEELITFYYIHSNLFSVDIKNNIFLFDRDEDKSTETKLKNKIYTLKRK